MKLIESKVEIIQENDPYKMIEIAGRTCYKSEENTTEDSAKEFVNRMIKSGHGGMLEHGTIYLAIPITTYAPEAINNYINNPYSRVHECSEFLFIDKYKDKVSAWCVTTNLRVLIENDCLEDLEFLCEPTEYHEKRVTVRFTCDRGVSHEFVRHRVFSFAQESTRYCNYGKDKFGNELTFIIPSWLDGDISNEDGSKFNDVYTDIYLHTLTTAENAYLDLLKQWNNKVPDKRFKSGYKNNPWTPQQARAVLPNSLKTELIMTGFESDWEGFFKLRCSKAAHPDAKKLADELQELMK